MHPTAPSKPLRAYGDRDGDGMVQMTFVLPVPPSARAREAEKVLRQQRMSNQPRPQPPVRVRVATQPTFTRYVFELPPSVSVTSEREKDSLTLVFGAPVKLDLADVKSALPPQVSSIDYDRAQDSTLLRFVLSDAAEVRVSKKISRQRLKAGPHGRRRGRPRARADDCKGLGHGCFFGRS